jgi:hypothetical protein
VIPFHLLVRGLRIEDGTPIRGAIAIEDGTQIQGASAIEDGTPIRGASGAIEDGTPIRGARVQARDQQRKAAEKNSKQDMSVKNFTPTSGKREARSAIRRGLSTPPICVGSERGKRPEAVGTQRRSSRRLGAMPSGPTSFDNIVNTAENEVRGKSSQIKDIEIPQIKRLHHDSESITIASLDLNPIETSHGLSSVSSFASIDSYSAVTINSSDDTIVSSSDQDPIFTLQEAIDYFIVDAQKEIDQFGR